MPASAPMLPRSLPALAVSFPVRISGFLLPLPLSLVRSVPTWGDRARERMKMRRARSAETVSATPAPDPVVAALIQQVLNFANGGGENNA